MNLSLTDRLTVGLSNRCRCLVCRRRLLPRLRPRNKNSAAIAASLSRLIDQGLEERGGRAPEELGRAFPLGGNQARDARVNGTDARLPTTQNVRQGRKVTRRTRINSSAGQRAVWSRIYIAPHWNNGQFSAMSKVLCVLYWSCLWKCAIISYMVN